MAWCTSRHALPSVWLGKIVRRLYRDQMSNTLGQLRERKVVQWAVAYLAGAWASLEVIDLVGGQFNWPDLLMRGITLAVAVGFFVVLVLAWFHGEKGRQRVSGSELLLIAGILAVGGGLITVLGPSPTEGEASSSADEPRNTEPAGAATFQKIAVKPFDNVMDDPEQDYFVDGMTDALIIELARIGSIAVVSRTSAMRFKNSDLPTPEIAAALSADALIEGTVFRAGNEVRISANLIDADRDEILWADTYEGTLSDVLRLQANVVLDIAEEINAALTPAQESQLASVTAVNADAIEAYARGRHFWNQRTQPSIERAIELLNQAVSLEPHYALAYAGLADAYDLQGIYEYIDPRLAYRRARETALSAIARDSLAGEPHTSLGHVKLAADHDWSGAEASFRRGVELSPNNSQSYLFFAAHLMFMGDLDGAERAMESARVLDPLAPLGGTFRTQLRLYRRDAEGAIQEALQALEIDPNFPATVWRLGESYLAAGENDLAVEAFERMAAITRRHPMFLSYLGLAYGQAGRSQDARDLIAEITADTDDPDILAGRLARVYLGLGEHDAAIAALDQSLATGQMVHLDLGGGPAWDPLRVYPAFQEILDQLDFPDQATQ